MGLVLSYDPNTLLGQINKSLQTSQQNITIDLQGHNVPLINRHNTEHFIMQMMEQARTSLSSQDKQTKKESVTKLQQTLAALQNKSNKEFFTFKLSAGSNPAQSDLCYKCSSRLIYETNGRTIRPSTACTEDVAPITVQLDVPSGRLALLQDRTLGSSYINGDDLEEIKSLAAPTIGLTYQAAQIVTKASSRDKKQVVVLGLDKSYRVWQDQSDIMIGLKTREDIELEEQSEIEADADQESNTDQTSTTSSTNTRKRKAANRKFAPRKRAKRHYYTLDCSDVVLMDYEEFEGRGLNRSELIVSLRVQPGSYSVTSHSEVLRSEMRHGLAVQLTRTGDCEDENKE